jgi:hypothetical protein
MSFVVWKWRLRRSGSGLPRSQGQTWVESRVVWGLTEIELAVGTHIAMRPLGLGLSGIVSFGAQSPAPHNRCVRFAVVVTYHATLSNRRLLRPPGPDLHRLEQASFLGARARYRLQQFLEKHVSCPPISSLSPDIVMSAVEQRAGHPQPDVHALMKASRSVLICSAFVVGMPCGKPG